MYISRNWLEDYISLDGISNERFEEIVTTRVAEVDGVELAASPVDVAIVAAVTKVEAHPSKDKLSVVSLSLGKEQVQVLCGAPNVREGMLSVYLAPGAKFRSAGAAEEYAEVEVRTIEGIESKGVLVSERELGLSGDHSGIIDLTPQYIASCRRNGSEAQAKAGELFSLYAGAADTILEIDNKSLTHRPDLWCHFGFVRELSAILDRPVLTSMDRFADNDEAGAKLLAELGSGKSDWAIEVAKDCGCYRFTGLELRGVQAIQSPLWLRRRLHAVGAGIRNVIVDLSNYVMHDIGQPNHTYDADLLSGTTLKVRLAKEGEVFDGLNDEQYTLAAEDMAVCDESGAIGLGGVLGGAKTAIRDETSRLLYEAASWDPVRVRKTSVRHALRTDASNRFEKSLSQYAVPLAQHRYVELMKELVPGSSVHSAIVDTFPNKPVKVTVPARFDYIRQRLGYDVPNEEITRMLSALGFNWIKEDRVEVPYYRATRDVSLEDDLVEEVGRTVGYENIAEEAPRIMSVAAPTRHVQEFEHTVRDLLCGMGFSETYDYSFMNPERAQAMGFSIEQAVELLNPVDVNQSHIRTTLVPGMVETLLSNGKNTSQLAMFELGRGYETSEDPRHTELQYRAKFKNTPGFERRLLTLLYASGRDESTIAQTVTPAVEQGADFFSMVTVVKRVVGKVSRQPLSLKPIFAVSGSNGSTAAGTAKSAAGDYTAYKQWMHPYRAVSLIVAGKEIGVLAEVTPQFREDFSHRAVIAEIDTEILIEADQKTSLFARPSKFPDSFFEMSVVMPKQSYYAELETLLKSNVDSELLRRIEVLSVYEGKPLQENEKSVSVKLFLGAGDRTLSGEELDNIQNSLMAAVAESSFSLRS